MTPSYPKRLIEVDLPIKRISAHARREKAIRHGHISTLHMWWARRPLAACRAVICASLWPDPADPLCPQSFRDEASKIMSDFAKAAVASKELGGSCDPETWIKWQALAKTGGLDSKNDGHWNILRFALLDFIADFANWDNSTVKEYLDTSRSLTQAAHESLGGEAGTRPLVVDPFAGGGSIPLEALRVGADTFASDLNPIPVLLNKVVLEYIPKYGQRLADEVRTWGEWVKREAEKELAEFYPKDADGATPIAYLWARTIRCEGPGCGAEVPLIKSLWLSKKASESTGMQLRANSKGKHIEIDLIAKRGGKWVNLTDENLRCSSPSFEGTVKRGSVTCPCCQYTTPVARVRVQLGEVRGGANAARLLCVVLKKAHEGGRSYRLPTEEDTRQTANAAATLNIWTSNDDGPLRVVPTEKIDRRGIRHTWAMIYGIREWGDCFTARQALALGTFAKLVRQLDFKLEQVIDTQFAEAIQTVLALAVGRLADYNSSLCRWVSSGEFIGNTFGRQALPMMWDFCEVNPFSGSTGGFVGACDWILAVLEREGACRLRPGHAQIASATTHPLPNDSASAVVTDPPYYDAVPYAFLSDFFYVWLRRSLYGIHSDLLRDDVVPKDAEIVVDRPHELSDSTHDIAYYESELTKAFSEAHRVVRPGGISTIVFASKTTASWEAILKAVIEAGWTITSSWPIDTEMASKIAAQGQARLMSSVHLVCRPRKNRHAKAEIDQVGNWRDILQELPRRIHEWMPRLASEGVVGADAIFACLGPALEVFSRYSRVETGSGEPVALGEYLEHVWAAVAKEALAQVFKGADATGFEPDARLTAMWLWTLNAPGTNGKPDGGEGDDDEDEEQETKKPKTAGFKLEYDAARKIAQGLGAVLENLTHLVEIKGDEARLLPVSERTRHLFGKEEEEPVRAARKKASAQLNMFAELTGSEDAEMAWQEKTVKRVGETTLDRVHQAMILFAAGRGEALKRFVVEDGVGQDGKFWRLADALNALYPAGSDERRWVEGVLARKKQFGF